MREVVLSTVGASLLAGWYLFSGYAPADNIYAMSVADAQNRLLRANILPGTGPFSGEGVSVSRYGPNQVRWTARGSHAGYVCDANIEQIEAQKVRVTSSCAGGSASDGAAASMTRDVKQAQITEVVDAALDGRPYDVEKMKSVTSAIGLKSMPSMLKDSVQMERNLRNMEKEIRAEQAAHAASQPTYAPPPTQPTNDFGIPVKFGEPTSTARPVGN
jgi:hypothetical protein